MLGPRTFGALSQAQVAVMPLARLQRSPVCRAVSRGSSCETKPGREAEVRTELARSPAGRLTVAPADQDVTLLHQALRPSDQASEFFAAISALLGFPVRVQRDPADGP